MPDIHPTAEQVAERAWALLWDTVSDPSIRKDALFRFIAGLVEKQRGDGVASRVTFALKALARGVALSGSTDWRSVIWAATDAVCGPRPTQEEKRVSRREQTIADVLRKATGYYAP